MGIWDRRRGRLPAPPPPPSEPSEPLAEFLAAPPTLRALLGQESDVSGKLSCSGPTRIDGRLRGEVRASDVLVIGETGVVEGTVRAAALVVLGRVDGQVLEAQRVEIGPRGRLVGTVETRALVVHDGGQLDAECRIAPPKTRVHVLRPRPAAETPSP